MTISSWRPGQSATTLGNTDIATGSFGLKDLAEALQLRNRILWCFARACWRPIRQNGRTCSASTWSRWPDRHRVRRSAGGAVAAMVNRDFPALHRDDVTITLVEGAEAALGTFATSLQTSATKALLAKGVKVRSKTTVSEVDETGLVLDDGERIDATTVVWAAGVRAVSLIEALGVDLASHGRVPVGPTLQLAGHPEVFRSAADNDEVGYPEPASVLQRMESTCS